MFEDASVKRALAEVGYERLSRLVYRAQWSTADVEHYIYFQLYGTPKVFLAADFGLKNAMAQAFAIESLRNYGGGLYRIHLHDERTKSFMRFSLGKWASWGVRSSLDMRVLAGVVLAEKIKTDIQDRLFPVIRNVTDLGALYALLLTDAEPYPWVRCNGALRAAAIVHIATRLGMPPAKISAVLKGHERSIRPHLREGPDPGTFIERLIEDAANSAVSCPAE